MSERTETAGQPAGQMPAGPLEVVREPKFDDLRAALQKVANLKREYERAYADLTRAQQRLDGAQSALDQARAELTALTDQVAEGM